MIGNYMRTIIALLYLLSLSPMLCGVAAEAAPLSRMQHQVRVIVNGSAITDYDLERRIILLAQLQRAPLDQKTVPILQKQALQLLVDEKLLEQEMRKRKLSVEES